MDITKESHVAIQRVPPYHPCEHYKRIHGIAVGHIHRYPCEYWILFVQLKFIRLRWSACYLLGTFLEGIQCEN